MKITLERSGLIRAAVAAAILVGVAGCVDLDIETPFPCSTTNLCPTPYACYAVGSPATTACYKTAPAGGVRVLQTGGAGTSGSAGSGGAVGATGVGGGSGIGGAQAG